MSDDEGAQTSSTASQKQVCSGLSSTVTPAATRQPSPTRVLDSQQSLFGDNELNLISMSPVYGDNDMFLIQL